MDLVKLSLIDDAKDAMPGPVVIFSFHVSGDPFLEVARLQAAPSCPEKSSAKKVHASLTTFVKCD